jgi:hypothetical protein
MQPAEVLLLNLRNGLVVALLIWLLVERWPFLPRTADWRRVAWRQFIRPEETHQRG